MSESQSQPPRDGARGARKRIPVSATPDADPESNLSGPDDRPRDKLGRARPETTTSRVDKLEAERRVEVVKKSIVQGFSTGDIVRYIDTQTDWGISRRQIFRYIEKAFAEVRAASKRDTQLELGKAIERNEMIIRKSLSPAKGIPEDLRVAVRANQANARLLGLEKPIRHRHGADPESPPLPGGDFIVLVQEVVE
jgi:hypothetical protein